MPDTPLQRSGSSRRDYLARVDGSTRMMQQRQRIAQAAALLAEADARTQAVLTLLNAERAARIYAVGQEARERIAADEAEAAARAQADADELAARREADGMLAEMIDAVTAALAREVSARAETDALEAKSRADGDKTIADRVAKLEAVTPVRKFAASFGNGILKSFDFKHNFGTRDLIVQVFSSSTFALVTPAEISMPDVNTVRITFVLALAANANRVVIVG